MPLPVDLEENFVKEYLKCKPFTMTSPERMYAAYNSAIYVAKNKIEGDIVECGVWKGGSIMVILSGLLKNETPNRKVYLYDTYEGMAEPTEKDVSVTGEVSTVRWGKSKKGNVNTWCYASIDEERNNIMLTNYPIEKVVFVKGKVEETIPGNIPGKIAILRLDTDW